MSRAITDQVGVARYPSPRLWKDCRHGLLNDLGLGFYQHAEFNGGFQSTTLKSAFAITIPDPTDSPANTDALRDDLTAVWVPFIESLFSQFGTTLALTALTNSLADTEGGRILLNADIDANIVEIEAAFLVLGETVVLTDVTTFASIDAIREYFVDTLNPEIEAAFATVTANDEYSMDDFEMDFDAEARLTAVTGKLGGFMDVETGPVDNNAFAFFLRPFGEIERYSGKKMWFEVAMEPGALADQAIFFGFAEEDALSRDMISDNCAALIGESYVGFRVLNDETGEVDAVYKLDAGTEVEVIDDATNSSGLPATQRSDIVAGTVRKYGLRFDGRFTIEFFVDGYKVGSVEATDALFPTNVSFGFVFVIKTGTAARQSAAVDWARVAYEEVH